MPVNLITIQLGAAVEMMNDLGFSLQTQTEFIICIETTKKIAWSMENKPGYPINDKDLKDYAEKRR